MESEKLGACVSITAVQRVFCFTAILKKHTSGLDGEFVVSGLEASSSAPIGRVSDCGPHCVGESSKLVIGASEELSKPTSF